MQIQNLQRANYAFNMLIDANFQFRRVKVTFLPMKTKDFSLLFFFHTLIWALHVHVVDVNILYS